MDNSGFSPLRENLSEQVANHLEQMIVGSSELNENSKLPSEQQLAAEYEVSRPVIREALKLLQERDLVTLKNGIGAFVIKPSASTLLSTIKRITQMNNISNDDLTQVRGMLEVNAARLAAEHISGEQIELLKENIKRFSDRTLVLKERVALDSEFHELIAKASGNALLTVFNEVLTSMLSEYMGKGVMIEGGIEDAIARHQKILDALERHDPDAAADAMTEHIIASKNNVETFDRNSGIKR